jgi:hypothetical protein
MPIMTVAEVKTLLGISGTTYDSQITAYLPIVQSHILEYCGIGKFRDENKQISVATIAFVEGGVSADTITDSGAEFISVAEFEAGMDIYVEGSLSNDGAYTIGTVVAGTITLDTGDDVVDEAAGELITISRIRWPKAIKKFAAMMTWENISAIKSGNVKAESVGDYSVTFDMSTGFGGYSNTALSGLNTWRCVRMA